MGKRRSSRELALQLLYQLDSLISSNSEKALIQESKKEFWENCGVNNVGRDIREYSDIIINGTLDNIEGIDKIIDKYSKYLVNIFINEHITKYKIELITHNSYFN